MKPDQSTSKSDLPEPGDVPDATRPSTTMLTTRAVNRKKGVGVRAWLLLDSTGQAQVMEAGKYVIKRRTGLPARDLRILDPLLSYPSTVLGRERAIVINLEHIKAIITAQEVLLLNPRDPSVIPFVKELQRRLLCHHHATKSQEGNCNNSCRTNLYCLQGPHSTVVSPSNTRDSSQFQDQDEEIKPDEKQGLENQDGSKVLPFEFVALEACLEAACSCLENEAKTLEQEAHPALDKLTLKISTLNLERVRQIKSRLVAIIRRVQKVRDELEHLLDDDEDMAEMFLTDKQQLENSSASSMNCRDGMVDEVLGENVDDRTHAEISMDAAGDAIDHEGYVQSTNKTQENLFGASNVLGRGSHGTHTSTTRSAVGKNLDVEELEMLLEAYFVQIDGTLNKLSTLREYVDDTEDYINIMLDDKQNHLLQMGVMLTTATLVVSAYIAVVGALGMNIHIELFDHSKPQLGMTRFLWTVGGCTTGSIFLYVVAIAWCKHKRLLE
ncbi:hypothetical protein CFOL_v3_34273 [Cephalotus follicularis]|uniref:Magnesium transporter n=1 Tax=Cephalotus follicularis TaxID=3775 RepID=A0A1Q3DEK2_CEPFO|nr:hypothetical protein CFOL_v3_34273 [Cephalotus follicularis]